MAKPKSGRTVTTLFGVFFVIMAVVILFAGWESTPVGAVVGALVVGILGADAIVSAMRDRRSLLSRIGPLP